MRRKFTRFLFPTVALLALALPILRVEAQGGDGIVFAPYQCAVDIGRNTLEVRGVLADDQGRPISEELYEVRVTGPDGALNLISAETVVQRPPMRLILVLDITSTMPIRLIEEGLIANLIPGLADGDEVALITFAEEIAPRTPFYTDKGELVNEHIRDLLPLEGDNRLYAAILEAVGDFPQGLDGRRVVLVLTDSGRRASDTTTVEEVIGAAQRQDVQVFSVGIFTRDRPAVEDLDLIAQETGGRLWMNTMALDSEIPFGEALGNSFEELVDTLNAEIAIQTDMPDIPPDEAGSFDLQIDLDVLGRDDDTLQSSLECRYDRLNHDIRFVNAETDVLVRATFDIQVAVETDLDYGETRVRFLDYDEELAVESVPESGIVTYTFDANDVEAGQHRISAQLVTPALRELASTPEEVVLNVQRALQLRYIPGPAGSGDDRLQVDSEGFSEVQFTIAPASAPDREVYYGSPVAFGESGLAALQLSEVRAEAARLFPELSGGDQYLIGAVVPGPSGSRYPLAVAAPVVIALTPPPEPVETPPAPEPFVLPNIEGVTIPAALAVILVVVNALLNRQVRWARANRLVEYPDNTPMNAQMMTVTVHRDGLKQAHTLTKRTVTVGRGPTNDINLGSDSSISRQYGVFMWRRGHWYFSFRKRRASANINGRRCKGPRLYRLKPVTEIAVGRTLLIFHSNAQQDLSALIDTDF